MPDSSTQKAFTVSLAVCIVCSVLVSSAAVSLKGFYEENRRLDRIRNILLAAAIDFTPADIEKVYDEIVHAELVELESGTTVPEEDFNEVLSINSFDVNRMAAHEIYGKELDDSADMAGIKRRPRHMVVYFIRERGREPRIVLPLYGKGLWSTMYGFIALDRELATVKGFTFYQHGETPGLGGEVDNPRWKKSWTGKQLFDSEGNVSLSVVRGSVDSSKPEAKFQVQGLSGATLTSRGVDNIIKFWLGKQGYGPFLRNLKGEQNGKV